MITLQQSQPIKHPGRTAKTSVLSSDEARAQAVQLLATLSAKAYQTLDLLATAGALSGAQLMTAGVAERTLRKYARLLLLERLPFPSDEMIQEFESYGLPVRKDSALLVYRLGVVGVEIAKMRQPLPYIPGYVGMNLSRVMHDIALNEVMLTLAAFAAEKDWEVRWAGAYEISVYDAEEKQQIIEPDAMLILRKGAEEKRFLIEFHNEDDRQRRAADKVARYEAAYLSELWKQKWEVEKFPPVLAVFREPKVGRGYQEAVKGRVKLNCEYFGRSLKNVLENQAEWYAFKTDQPENIFP